MPSVTLPVTDGELGCHAASAEDAWRRILAFFDAHLETSPSQGTTATGGHGPDGSPPS
jgi:hypothetical protein